MTPRHCRLAGLALIVALFGEAPAHGQAPEGALVSRLKESTYYGKWKLGDLLERYCEKTSYGIAKGDENHVAFYGTLKKGGGDLVVNFRLLAIAPGPGKDKQARWLAVTDGATINGKKEPAWDRKVLEKEYREAGSLKVEAVKASAFYRWKLGELVAKHCDGPTWRFLEDKDLVELRAKLKKGGEVAAKFLVVYGSVDKSNTAAGWVIVDEGATVGGATVEGSAWRARVFVEEAREGQGKGEK